MKKFEYLPLRKELKTQAHNPKKQYEKLDDNHEFDKITKNKKPKF